MKKPADNFNKYIAISIAFHLAVFIFLTVRILFFPTEMAEHQSAVRVDVVALPEKQVTPPQPAPEEPKKPEPVAQKEEPKPEPPKPKPKKPKKVALEKKKKKKKKPKDTKKEQNSALARLKAMQKLKNKNKDAKPSQEFKGNQVSKGNSLSGLAKLHDQSYMSDLESHIKSHWVLPEWLRDGNYQAIVVVFISRTGSIKNKTFVTKSGNKLFDEQVLSTLEKANPLPKPPSNLIDFYSNKGVKVSFP